MKVYHLIWLVLVLSFHACKDQPKSAEMDNNQALNAGQEESNIPAMLPAQLPKGSAVLSPEFVAHHFGVDPQLMQVKDIRPSKESKGCFYQWDAEGVKSGGVMIRMMTNPEPAELPDWPKQFIDAKISHGEGNIEGDKVTYEPWDAVGVTGAASSESSQYFWRTANGVVFQIAFNLAISIKDEKKAARILAKEAMKNFNS